VLSCIPTLIITGSRHFANIKERTTVAEAGRGRMIRVGVVGVGRGQSFARGATDVVGMRLVAVCDTWEERPDEWPTHRCPGFSG
jgi:hypothetical protein